MEVVRVDQSGFSESDINLARQAFFRDCPNGRCSKRKFLTFIRKSALQKTLQSNIHIIKILQNYRQSKKFFSMMFDIYDQNHDGELDFDEYIYALSAITGANRLRTIETLFKFFDVHNRDFITHEDFNSRQKLAAQFLGQYKTGFKDDLSYEQAFDTMDKDKDGRISKEEFIQWHLKDHCLEEQTKPIRKRTRLLRNLSTLVDIRGQIKTSSLQQKEKTPVDIWLETSMNMTNHQELSSIVNADRYLLKIFRRARNRFYNRKNKIQENQSESGVFTSSSITTFIDNELDSDSLLDSDEDDLQPIEAGDTDSQLLCQSLEEVLMETLLELRQQRLSSHPINSFIKENEQTISCRL